MDHERWSKDKANSWYDQQPWLVGCNFIPSTAINQLEMWQKQSFDVESIGRELAWAADLGFNSLRVYLHDLLWLEHPAGFKQRIRRFLDLAAPLKISTIFVLFDDCWNPDPHLGQQPHPKPGLHNSGWVQSPGMAAVKAREEWGRLEDYVVDTVESFGADERVLMWDVYNEPGNGFLTGMAHAGLRRPLRLLGLLLRYLLLPIPSLPLLLKTFDWARAAKPSQPLTSPLWFLNPSVHSRLNGRLCELSDVITFHDYDRPQNTITLIGELRGYGRPLICTEYLARTRGNLFTTHLPLFKQEKIGCYNWGLVSGKTQTIYVWQSRGVSDEPPIWFHDILRGDGTPYDPAEVEFIRQMVRG